MRNKIAQLKDRLREACSRPAALWFSGGRDSLLLLYLAVDMNLAFSVLRFDDGWSVNQRAYFYRTVSRFGKPLFSYPPVRGTIIGDGGKKITYVATYAVGRRGESLPIVRDLVDGDRCMFDVNIPIRENATPPVFFETHILGGKRIDRHYSREGAPFATMRTVCHEQQVILPLFDWTGSDVVAALALLEVPYSAPNETQETGKLACCHRCMLPGDGKVFCPKQDKEIDRYKWSPADNLAAWKQMNDRSEV